MRIEYHILSYFSLDALALYFVTFFVFLFFVSVARFSTLFNKIFDASRAAVSMYAPSG